MPKSQQQQNSHLLRGVFKRRLSVFAHMLFRQKVAVCVLFLQLPFFVWVERQDVMIRWHTQKFMLYLIFALSAYLLTLVFLHRAKVHPGFVLGVGCLYGFLLLSTTPVLSTDVYRYIWDGRVSTSGRNVYQHKPEELVELQSKDALYEAMGYKTEYTVYPPVAQHVFSVTNFFYEHYGLSAAKAILALPYVVIAWLLWKLLRPERKALFFAAYCLNPLLLFEVFGSAHIEGYMLLFVVTSYYFFTRHKPTLAVLTLLFAVLTKLWPLILLPSLMMAIWRQSAGSMENIFQNKKTFLRGLQRFMEPRVLLRTALPLLVAAAVGYALYFPYTRENWFALSRIRSWVSDMSFNSPFHTFGEFMEWSFVARKKIATLLILSVAILTLWKKSLASTWMIMVIVFVMVSPVFYPWYILLLLPLAVLVQRRSVIVATTLLYSTSVLSYYQQEVFLASTETTALLKAVVRLETIAFLLLLAVLLLLPKLRQWLRRFLVDQNQE
jgi:alpha-1,6-mannosyltransferase